MAQIEFDVKDYLREVSARHLIGELQQRGYVLQGIKSPPADPLKNKLAHIADLLGVQPWQGSERVIENLRELIAVVKGE